MATNLSGYLGAFLRAGETARQRTQERLDQALGIYDQNIAMYQPGGDFGKGFEASLGQAKQSSVSGGMAHLAKTGLYNSSIGAGLGTAFEKTVGTPARLQMNDMRIGRLSDAYGAKAGVLERVNDTGPDPSLLSNLMMQAANQPRATAQPAAYSPHPWESSYMGGGWTLGSAGPSNVGGGTLNRLYG